MHVSVEWGTSYKRYLGTERGDVGTRIGVTHTDEQNGVWRGQFMNHPRGHDKELF